MSIPVRLVGRNNRVVEVSENGEVLMRPFDYSTSKFQLLDTVDTAFNFFTPLPGKQLVISGISISGNRDIGVNGSILVIYEAADDTTLTVGDSSIEFEVPKSTIVPFIQPNAITSEGSFINAKCDDNNVRVTLFGFFVPTIPS